MNDGFEGRRRGCLEVHELDLVGGEVTTADEFSERPLGGFAVEYDKRADKQSQAAIVRRHGSRNTGSPKILDLYQRPLAMRLLVWGGRHGWPQPSARFLRLKAAARWASGPYLGSSMGRCP